ncbi:MAG TPA: NrtA/SsuA/CpmA family ABC transporter substrate-binding protein [Baekduia sp.]|uniref:NrtA/SsuA/CpmA family ABC transporter substrate-binding protein n=1 Tax=Baekduia sp. TaxID=2600305 RepID=UPI002D77B407|nr:NrtA/SsuA/CpmA family ABC transporter substrate-binding protein [Baekduia sp.]HET6510153.1 NrtA/SsuA/CpmA family ABC transporter substrate-binding protein [Baekduia sp.]
MTFSRHRTRTLALTASVLAAAALTTTACGSGDDGAATAASSASGAGAVAGGGGTVRIALIGTTGPTAAAKNDGSLAKDLAKVGAKVQFTGQFPAFAPAAEAINAGALDAAQGSISSAVGALAQKPSFKIYAAQLDNAKSEGILVKDPNIKSVADLVGKKVAVNPKGTGEYLLLKALEKNGVDPAKVERVYLGAADGATAFSSGKVDAWAAWGDFVATAKAKGARLLADGDQVGSENDTIWVISDTFLKAHPATVKALYENQVRHSQEEHADPEGAVAQENTGAIKLDDKAAAILADNYRDQDPVAKIDATFQRRFGDVSAFFAAQKVIPTKLDPATFTVDATTLGG